MLVEERRKSISSARGTWTRNQGEQVILKNFKRWQEFKIGDNVTP